MNIPSFMLAVIACAAAVSVSAEGHLPKVREADVYILGEVHDNPGHHQTQAEIVSLLAPKALVFEMLSDAQALRIRPAMLENADELAATLDWADSGWPDFAMYFPIFEAAADSVIFGGALPRENVRQAVSDGAAAVFGPGASLFGLDTPLDDTEQTAREAGQMSAHCDALPVSMLNGMVEAQRLRDAGLARAVIAAMNETGGPVAVITGNGHARKDWGIPAALEFAAPELTVWSFAQFENPPDGDVPFDDWVVTDGVDREDPCLAFNSK